MKVANKRRYATSSILALAGAAVVVAALLTTARGGPAGSESEEPVSQAKEPEPAEKPEPQTIAARPEPPEPKQPLGPEEPPKPPPRPRIDVVFALDTTGSMSSLIAGAKQKIWSLANEIASGQPRPIVRFGLVGYRDRTDTYVTKVVGLTRDMDSFYENLMSFQAAGGGDTPEDVNRALSDSVNKMKWGGGQNVLKLVFLVGDAPPHEDYDGPNSSQLARRARRKGIIINTVRAGRAADTERSWRRIARIAGGQFDSIAQSGGMVAVSSPHDAELERLNRALASTSIGYGSSEARAMLDRKRKARMEMKSEVAASAASYSAKARGGLGRGDLIADVSSGRLSLDDLDKADLPDEMKNMSESERRRHVAKKKAERKKIQRQILAVSKKRDAWLKKNASEKTKRAFDKRVMRSVETQAADLGVTW